MADAKRLPVPFRICLDINVWVAAEFGILRGRTGTVAQDMVSLVASQHLNNRPLQLVIGVEMITTLGKVLVRHGVSTDVAAEFGRKITRRPARAARPKAASGRYDRCVPADDPSTRRLSPPHHRRTAVTA